MFIEKTSISFAILLFALLLQLSIQTPIKAPEDDEELGIGVKISNGSLASSGEFPWLISLHWQGGHFCEGVLITPILALTTASCASIANSYYLDMYAGLLRQSQNDSVGVQKRSPQTMLNHPQYLNGGFMRNDLSLLKLSNPFVFDDDVVSGLPLPTRGQGVTLGMTTIAGWGSDREEHADPRDALAKANVLIVGGQECQNAYGSEDFDDATMICVRSVDGSDFCNGDNGTPLIARDGERLYVAGLASWGQGCGDPAFPSVYTKLASYIDWIENNT